MGVRGVKIFRPWSRHSADFPWYRRANHTLPPHGGRIAAHFRCGTPRLMRPTFWAMFKAMGVLTAWYAYSQVLLFVLAGARALGLWISQNFTTVLL